MLIQMLILIDAYPDADPEHFLVQNLVSRIFAELIAASLKKKKHAKGRSVALFRRVGPASGNHFSGEWEQASALAQRAENQGQDLLQRVTNIFSKKMKNMWACGVQLRNGLYRNVNPASQAPKAILEIMQRCRLC